MVGRRSFPFDMVHFWIIFFGGRGTNFLKTRTCWWFSSISSRSSISTSPRPSKTTSTSLPSLPKKNNNQPTIPIPPPKKIASTVSVVNVFPNAPMDTSNANLVGGWVSTHLKKYATVKLDHLPTKSGWKFQKSLSCYHVNKQFISPKDLRISLILRWLRGWISLWSHHLATNVNHALQQLGLMVPPLRCQYTSSQSWEGAKVPAEVLKFQNRTKKNMCFLLTFTFIQYKQNIYRERERVTNI